MGISRWVSGPWFLVFALSAGVFGCGSKDSKSDACTKGSEGCACDEGSCAPGLSCLSMFCVNPNAPSGGGGSNNAGHGGRSATAGASSTNGGSANGDAGATGTEGGAPANSGGRAANLGGTASSSGGTTSSAGAGQPGGGMNPSGGTGASTPVSRHGALSVKGANLVDASGAGVKLEGMSSMWLNWDTAGYASSKEGLQWMRDNWNLRILRAAMGVAPDAEPNGAYLGNPAKYKGIVNQIVQNAIDLGVYVIIDWHDHEALAHQADAVAFFQEMSAKWGGYPNVLYEVFNEPLALNWASELKPYHQALVSAIRANDPDNVILLGTPNWDQDVDVAANSPLSGTNLMYTLHFYACTHQAANRAKAQTARSRGLPIFVSEWGATHADGGVDGVVCESEARTWHDWLDASNISWTAWKLDGCTDSSCMFKDQTVPVTGGWTSSQLNGHAPIVIDEMKNDPPSSSGGSTGTGGATGKGGAVGSGGAVASGGALGTGGTGAVDNFPPDPAGCALVTSCTDCCSTTGAFALDTASKDATSRVVKAFSVSTTSASAAFTFGTYDEIGAIFFALSAPTYINSLGLDFTGSGGSYEVALVSSAGANGCIYPVVSGSIASLPDTCWGDGAGPYAGTPVDQIEIRVRALASGYASLTIYDVQYGSP